MPEQEQAKPNGSLKLARPYHENKLGFMGATKAGQSHSICVIRAEYQQLQFQGVFELSSGDVWYFWGVLATAMATVIVRFYESKSGARQSKCTCVIIIAVTSRVQKSERGTQERYYRWFSMAFNGLQWGSWQCKTLLIQFANVVIWFSLATQMRAKHWSLTLGIMHHT